MKGDLHMAKKNAKSPFTQAQLDYFSERLQNARDELVKQIRVLSSSSLISSRQAGEELADVGSDDFIRETELALMTEEGKQLALINLALESIQNGTYGICVDCEKVISEGRLRAKPFARLCIDCKTLREKDEGFSYREGSETMVHELVE